MAQDKAKQLNEVYQNIPFDNLIGVPLQACIRAQEQAAQATLDYIQEVGFKPDADNKGLRAANVTFEFVLDGVRKLISIPLITLVPLPYIHIGTVDLSFNTEVQYRNGTLEGRVSSDDYRKEVSESKTNYDYNSQIAIEIHASEGDLPMGVTKLLDILGQTIG